VPICIIGFDNPTDKANHDKMVQFVKCYTNFENDIGIRFEETFASIINFGLQTRVSSQNWYQLQNDLCIILCNIRSLLLSNMNIML
jgi:hypothetical protein